MKFVSDKRTTVPSIYGHHILFLPGRPVEVDERDYDSCRARGCVPADKVEAVVETMDRVEEITGAVQTLLDEGDQDNFTSMGTPKVKPIERILGYDITAEERDQAWSILQGS